MGDRVALENGLIVDGSGRAPFAGTVIVEDGLIEVVGPGASSQDASRVDVGGLAVAPGFIDMHNHSDVSVLSDPDCVSAVWQGVTSQIVGHCGFSASPTDETTRRTMVREEPVFGFPRGNGQGSRPWGWASIGEYLDVIGATRPRTNFGTLVGHNTLRRLVVGSSTPTGDDLRRMSQLVGAAIDEGALGVSTGLSYPPGMYAGHDEVVTIARAAARAGRRYHTHMRDGVATIRESLREAIETGREADCPVNVSHLYPRPTDDEREAETLLEMIRRANDDGGEVTFDLTLFRRGGGAWSQSLPTWALENGLSVLIESVGDPDQRERLLTDIRRLHAERDWDDDLIVKVSGRESAGLVGRTIAGLASEWGITPEEAVVSLLEQDAQFWVAPTIKRQSDLDILLQDDRCVPVTDGMTAHPHRHAHLGLMPKTFGTFPLLLGDYVRSRGVISLGEAVSRITSMPAERLGLGDRGRLAPGYRADLVVFDPEAIENTATDESPAEQPVGIRDVMVNGMWAMRDGKLTPNRNGQVLT